MLDYRVDTFLEVCRQGSFTKAAQALAITQPAVSQHVRFLEKHYGCKLFETSGRISVLTAAGAELHRALVTMRNDERVLEQAVARLDEAAPPLHFGATRTVSEFAMPRFLASWCRAHPATPTRMLVGNTRTLLDLIDAGSIEFALVEGPFDEGAYDHATFSGEAFIAVGSPETREPGTLRGMLGERLVLREEGSGSREILEQRLAERNLTVGSFAGVTELASIECIKACVAAGLGVSFLYRIAVERELAEGTLVDVTPPDFRRGHPFALVWRRGSMFADRYRSICAEWQAAYA